MAENQLETRPIWVERGEGTFEFGREAALRLLQLPAPERPTAIVTLNDTQWAFGYPAEGKYKGKDLIYCKGSTVDDPYDVGTWGMACNMNGG